MILLKTSRTTYVFERRWYGIRWRHYNKYYTTRRVLKDTNYVLVSVYKNYTRRRWLMKFRKDANKREQAKLMKKLATTLEEYETYL